MREFGLIPQLQVTIRDIFLKQFHGGLLQVL